MSDQYFIILRYVNSGYVEAMTTDEGGVKLFDTEEEAEDLMRDNMLVQSGQIAYVVYEVP